MADDSLAPVEAWALDEIFHCLLGTMTVSVLAEVFFIDPPAKWHPLV